MKLLKCAPGFAAASLVLAIVAGGCAKRESPAQQGIRTQTLLVGNAAEPADLDPQSTDAQTDANIENSLFEGLTWIDAKTTKPVPALAERWDVSPDSMIYTFHLRPNALWSNGDPVTADDFVYSFHRILTPAYASTYSYMLWPIRNARAFNTGELTDFSRVGVQAMDPHTLRITLEKPTPYLAALAAHNTWLPVHRATIENFGRDDEKGTLWTRPGNLVGNGPFTLAEWVPNARIVVKKNPRYWDAAHVRLNSIVFYPIEDRETEEFDFRAGQLHVTFGLPIADLDHYRKNDPQELQSDPILASFYLLFNVARPPLNDVRVRQALSLAIDREKIMRDVMKGTRAPAYNLTPPDCGGYTARARTRTDFDAARRLLSEAGYPGGKGLPTFGAIMYSTADTALLMEAIQETWRRELGVNMTITPLEQKTFFADEKSLQFTIGMSGWGADYADPSTFLNLFVTGGGNNWAGWSDKEYDSLISQTTNTADARIRYELFQKAEALLIREAPIAPLFFDRQIHLKSTAVHGYDVSALGFTRFQDVWLGD